MRDDATFKNAEPARPQAIRATAFSKAAVAAFLLAPFLLALGSIASPQARAAGETRTISLHHVHTKETLTITYKKNGVFDEEALKKINWAMRDWRTDGVTKIDPQAIDLLWELYQDVGGKEPIQIIGGYRSPGTNAMLRSRSKGVARHSQHMLGKAIDFYIPGVPLETIRAAGMRLQGGGVGYYPTSGSPFVHLDVGNVRAWPRMTREQLVKLFPNGRTVHIPTDGTPLPGYHLALADLERGQRTAAPLQKRSLLASLFGGKKDDEEIEDNSSFRETTTANRDVKPKAPSATAPAPTRTVVAAAPSASSESATVPLPPRRPAFQLAAAAPPPAPSQHQVEPVRVEPVHVASLSPNEIVRMRGHWANVAEAAPTTIQKTFDTQRNVAAATPLGHETTGSIGSHTETDRSGSGLALAYASPDPAAADASAAARTIIITKSDASVVHKPIETLADARVTQKGKLDDPWLRGLMLAANAKNSLVVTPVGETDMTGLTQHMAKPASALVMAFTRDPHSGTTAEKFSGSAVVFPATVIFNAPPQRTAALR